MQSTDTKRTPQTSDEWAIHSLNIHGTFFEKWCEHAIRQLPPWQVTSTQYPVQFPPSEEGMHTNQSALDLRIALPFERSVLTISIECKKNNPDFIDWIFYPRDSLGAVQPIHLTRIACMPKAARKGFSATRGLVTGSLCGVICDEAREVKGTYLSVQDKSRGYKDNTKTSNAAITDAAWQIALATQTLILEDEIFATREGEYTAFEDAQFEQEILLPMIVTTANLKVLGWDPSDVDPATGEVPFEKVNLQAVPWVVYQYAVPRQLELLPPELKGKVNYRGVETFARMHILVVNSRSLIDVLTMLRDQAKSLAN